MLIQRDCICLTVSSMRGREPLRTEVSNLRQVLGPAGDSRTPGMEIRGALILLRSLGTGWAAVDRAGVSWVAVWPSREDSVLVSFPLALEISPGAILISLTVGGQSCPGCVLGGTVDGVTSLIKHSIRG